MLNKIVFSLLFFFFSCSVLATPPANPVNPINATNSSVIKTTAAQQNVSAERSTKATIRVSSPKVVLPALNLAPHYFYAGVGISMLNDKGFTGLMPKAYVGYGAYFGNCKLFYGAFELFGGASSLPLSPNQQYRVGSIAGFSVIPGFLVVDWAMLYGRVGFEAVRYSNLNASRRGLMLGIGVDVYTTEHWDTRFEYAYSANKNLNQYNIDFIYKFA